MLVVEGKRDNIKLTVPEDYLMLAAAVRTMYMKRAKNDRGGLGDSAQSLGQSCSRETPAGVSAFVNPLGGHRRHVAHVVIGGTE